MTLPFLQAPPVQAQVATTLPPEVETLLKSRDWTRLADLFETLTPQQRGRHYEIWLQALNKARRWERLASVCEALLPQLEAKSGPRLGTCRLYRAQALSQLGRHGEAMSAHAANGEMGYPDGWINACVEARAMSDWSAMERYAERILASNPKHAEGLAWKGESLARRNLPDQAEPLLRSALASDPKLAHAWSNLGLCLNERKAWTEAQEACGRALDLDPQLVEARYNRGRSLFELKRYQAAVEDFEAALAVTPEDPVLQENLRQARRYLEAESKGKAASKRGAH